MPHIARWSVTGFKRVVVATRPGPACAAKLIDTEDFERRVLGRDGAELIVAGVWPGALEEDPDLCLPPFQVGAQHRDLLVVGELSAAEALGTPAHSQFTGSGGAQVAYPLGLAAGCDEVTAATDGEQVHRRGTPLPARAALDRQDPRAQNADALPGQECHRRVENATREPSWRSVLIGHAARRSQRATAKPPARTDDDVSGKMPISPGRRPDITTGLLTREHTQIRALIDCAKGCLAGDELIDVAVRSAEVLPRRSLFAQQLDACPSQLVHGRGQVADGEADNRAGGKMLLARIAAAENLDMPPVRKLEDPEIRFRMHQPEAKNMLVEMRQFTAAACSRPAPSKACDLHACQHHHDQGNACGPKEHILFCRESASLGSQRVAPAVAAVPIPAPRRAAGLPAGASRGQERHDEHLYCFAGRKRNADQVSSIDTWRTGCRPWPASAAASRSRLRSVPSWPPLG